MVWVVREHSEPECVIYSLMYQIIFRTTKLLLYPLLFNKNMGFSLAIPVFFSHSLVNEFLLLLITYFMVDFWTEWVK